MEMNQLVTKPKRRKVVFQTNIGSERNDLLEKLGYTLISVIGHGSFSKVWKAKSERKKKEVAIKIIGKHKNTQEYVEKFLPREVAIIRKLRHKHLLHYIGVSEDKNSVYIVMELAEKGTLADLIEQRKRLSENEAKGFFTQIIDVIDFCHRNGVVHRDIKCENILVNGNNHIILIDFGFAKSGVFPRADGRINRSRTYCGSYAYASPEILENLPYNPFLADVWCMGMVLYSMVIGHLPYRQNDLKMLLAAKKRPPSFPLEPTLSPHCKNFIRRMLVLETERLHIPQLRKDAWLASSSEEPQSQRILNTFQPEAGPSGT